MCSIELEKRIQQAAMSWEDNLYCELTNKFGGKNGSEMFTQYRYAFPAGYKDDFAPSIAIDDIHQLNALYGSDGITISVYRVKEEYKSHARLRLIHVEHPMPLSDVMPILKNMGLRVIDEIPYEIVSCDDVRGWVHEFTIEFDGLETLDINHVSILIKETFTHVWRGDAENNSFNQLVISAQLSWREAALLRAYSRYMKQLQLSFSQDYIAECLRRYTPITKDIIALFTHRFGCDLNLM